MKSDVVKASSGAGKVQQDRIQKPMYTPKEPSTARLRGKVEEWKREAFVSGTLK